MESNNTIVRKHFNHRRGVCVVYERTQFGFVGHLVRIPRTDKPNEERIFSFDAEVRGHAVN